MAARRGGSQRGIFITVGTTSFDGLIALVDTRPFADAMCDLGYGRLTVQFGERLPLCAQSHKDVGRVPSESGCHAAGRGEHEPAFAAHKLLGLECRYYRFTDSQTLQADMAAASLVLSHAGAGSILESLALTKPLVVAVSAGFLFACSAAQRGRRPCLRAHTREQGCSCSRRYSLGWHEASTAAVRRRAGARETRSGWPSSLTMRSGSSSAISTASRSAACVCVASAALATSHSA